MAGKGLYPVLVLTLASPMVARSVAAQPISQPSALDSPGSPATAPTSMPPPGEASVTVVGAAHKTASALVQCKVAEGGTLKDCVVLSENPAGKGFGVAALKLTPMFRLKLKPDGPSEVGGLFRTNITFKLAP